MQIKKLKRNIKYVIFFFFFSSLFFSFANTLKKNKLALFAMSFIDCFDFDLIILSFTYNNSFNSIVVVVIFGIIIS